MKKLCILLFIGNSLCAFKLGVENIEQFLLPILKKSHKPLRFALISNQTSVDSAGQRTVDALCRQSVNIAYICAPEHGVTGMIPASHEVHHGIDKKTNIVVCSLYKKDGVRDIDHDMLASIDGFIFDIQDCGMRHYTYISTLLNVMRVAAAHHKQMIVLDRPNPLGGAMEGPLVEDHLRSFISCASIPVRHGMTCGELARYFNRSILASTCNLLVVPMSGYQRNFSWGNYTLPVLSPNIKQAQSCYGYSFLGLLGEVRSFDVGIGTEHAFQYIMLPASLHLSASVWSAAIELLRKYHVVATEHHYFSVRKRRAYHGLKISIPNIEQVPACTILVSLIDFFKRHTVALQPSASFAKAFGSDALNTFFNAATTIDPSVIHGMNAATERFYQMAHASFLYWPYPRIVPITLN